MATLALKNSQLYTLYSTLMQIFRFPLMGLMVTNPQFWGVLAGSNLLEVLLGLSFNYLKLPPYLRSDLLSIITMPVYKGYLSTMSTLSFLRVLFVTGAITKHPRSLGFQLGHGEVVMDQASLIPRPANDDTIIQHLMALPLEGISVDTESPPLQTLTPPMESEPCPTGTLTPPMESELRPMGTQITPSVPEPSSERGRPRIGAGGVLHANSDDSFFGSRRKENACRAARFRWLIGQSGQLMSEATAIDFDRGRLSRLIRSIESGLACLTDWETIYGVDEFSDLKSGFLRLKNDAFAFFAVLGDRHERDKFEQLFSRFRILNDDSRVLLARLENTGTGYIAEEDNVSCVATIGRRVPIAAAPLFLSVDASMSGSALSQDVTSRGRQMFFAVPPSPPQLKGLPVEHSDGLTALRQSQ